MCMCAREENRDTVEHRVSESLSGLDSGLLGPPGLAGLVSARCDLLGWILGSWGLLGWILNTWNFLGWILGSRGLLASILNSWGPGVF